MPRFLRWLNAQDRERAFDYLRQLLQYLQWQFHSSTARPWVLKSPINLGFERQMASTLKGARFVVLHRSPIEVIPSTVAIVRELRRLYCGNAGDLRKVGLWALEEYSTAMARHLAWRKPLPADAVLDIAYTEIRDDYVSVVERIYRYCGLPLSTRASQGMASWAGDNEQHKHGIHHYTLEESGLSTQLIEQKFSDYLSAFAPYLAI